MQVPRWPLGGLSLSGQGRAWEGTPPVVRSCGKDAPGEAGTEPCHYRNAGSDRARCDARRPGMGRAGDVSNE